MLRDLYNRTHNRLIQAFIGMAFLLVVAIFFIAVFQHLFGKDDDK